MTLSDSVHSTGKKAPSVMRLRMKLRPRSSMVRGETHGVLLHLLRRTLNVTQAWPGRHVVLIHCLAPAEDVVFAEKIHQHRRRHIDHGDACKGRKLPPELLCGDAGLAQSLLDQVVLPNQSLICTSSCTR